MIWDDVTKECSTLDMPINDPTVLTWSKVKSHLAIGTASGNILLYKEFAEAPISIMSVLSSSITSGLWGYNDFFLAVASVSSKTLVVLDEEGEHVLQLQMKFPAFGFDFVSTVGNTSAAICINSGGRVLYVKDMDRSSAPLELSFDHSRGLIVKCIWIDGMILLGFNSGELLLLSTCFSDQKRVSEVWSRTFNEVAPLFDLQYIPFKQRILISGKEHLSFFDFFEQACVPISTHAVSSCHPHIISVSQERGVFCVAKNDGKLAFYKVDSQVPTHASDGTHVAFMSSPLNLTYVNAESSRVTASLTLPFEPSILATGPSYIAVGNGSMVLVYSKISQELIFRKENLKRVCYLNVNSRYLAFFSDLALYVFELSSPLCSNNDSSVVMSFEEDEVTCLSMTEHFIIFGTSKGAVEFVSLAQRKSVDSLRYKHPCGLKYLLPSPSGTRILLVDVSGKALLFLPSSQTSLQFSEFPKKFERIIWDKTDSYVVNVIDDIYIHCYVYLHNSIRGTLISKLGQVHVDEDGGISIYPAPFQLRLATKPILCNKGEFVFLDNDQLRFAKSPFYFRGGRIDEAFAAFLPLLKFDDSWREALKINERRFWLALANKALEVLDIEVAIRVYRLLNDAGMVLALEKLLSVEDKNLLSGYILMIFMDYDAAQDSFLRCKRVDIAIDMRLNMLRFDEALSLASKVCQDKLLFDVSLKYGQHLELIGKSERALAMYDAAFNLCTRPSANTLFDTEACSGGLARSLIRSGKFERGFEVAQQINNVQIKLACAELLLSFNQPIEAAALFEHCQVFDKAAEIYLRIKHVTFLGKILDKITSPKLIAEIGKVFEEAGRNRLAMDAYARAGKVESFVKMNLRTTGDVKAALDMVKRYNSIESAKILTEYCLQQATVDFLSVIELLVISAQHEKAFSIAKENNLVDFFAEQSVTEPDVAIMVGKYYEDMHLLGKSGKFYSKGGQYDRAMRLYLEGGEDHLNDAIELAILTKDISHVNAVVDYLSAERNGEAKYPLQLYKVLSSLENFGEAVTSVSSIAIKDQKNGKYSKAHMVIASLIAAMESKNTFIPHELRSTFILYHSYKLVKFHAKRGNHQCSASLLLRVVDNLDDFPCHRYEVLVSTVIECLNAGYLVRIA